MSAHTELSRWASGDGGVVRSLHLHGHRLFDEGRIFRGIGRHGEGKCSCGALSEILESDAARKRWHRFHLVRVLTNA